MSRPGFVSTCPGGSERSSVSGICMVDTDTICASSVILVILKTFSSDFLICLSLCPSAFDVFYCLHCQSC